MTVVTADAMLAGTVSRRAEHVEAFCSRLAGAPGAMVSLDALAFVRFGLLAPDDPRILSTVKMIEATLKVETPRGPVWRRYQGEPIR